MSKNSLDLTPNEFKQLLDDAADLVLSHFENLESKKAFLHFPQQEVQSWFDEPLPEAGMETDELLGLVKEKVLNTSTGNLGPHMYAYVMAGGNQMGIVAEQLAATINQNCSKWHLAPALIEMEKRVVQWASDLIGFGDNIGGVLVASGSAANFDGLTVARNLFFEKQEIREKGLFSMKPFAVYTSTETHNCIDKTLEILGIGTNNLRKIATLADFTIDLAKLEDQMGEDLRAGLQPFCIIGNAGTVNTGAIDDLAGLAAIAKKYNMWFHVDGAYGGLASSLESKKQYYKGLELADSIALDFHKWLYQPFEVGCILVKNWDALKRTYYKNASYLDNSLEGGGNRLNFNEHHFKLSRNAKALKVWMSIKFYGIRKIKEMIQKDIDLTDYLSSLIEKSDDFELKATSHLAVSCFQYKGELTDPAAIIKLNQELIPALEQDGRIFIAGTRLNDEFVLRACLINHRKDKKTVAYLLEVIRDVASKIRGKSDG